jgi:ABC-2 type transport system ATP-binding protein
VAVRGVGRRFGAEVALDDVSLSAHGGVVALLGPNGAGKTTLLRCLATVGRPDVGTVHVDGFDATDTVQRIEVRRRLGYLPQQVGFAERATVFDVVDHVGILKELGPPRVRHVAVVRALRDAGLVSLAGRRVGTLSGGMRQRLGIAQALVGEPSLLLLDEPANGLDPEERLRLRDRLSEVGERATVVLSTHLTEEAAAFSQVLYVLVGGRIVHAGTPADLTATARGRVWIDSAPRRDVPGVLRSWRLPSGAYRCIGDPPSGVVLDEPTLEDAYLLLVGGCGPARGPQ